ncbi:hypothetical protein [Sphingomonas sp. SRS2]|uniref:hypothetical protein n=1 Tax=Sphingomonas sp. SRS2 TaxID=133190 RepID=UPI00061846EA|nr:hypothetical protein [Sphingomonas sp. SRS2]KKC24949.1 hypothetical protein WP12_17175 [Sphingomonas sp. SRS2]
MDFPKLLDVLRNIPLWLTGAIAAGCLFVLYGPSIRGLPLDAARDWPMLGVVTVFAVSLALSQIVALGIKAAREWQSRRKPPRLNFICDDHRGRSFWADGGTATKPITQIRLSLTANNPAPGSARVVKVRIRRPRFIRAAEISSLSFQSPMQIGGSIYSSKGTLFGKQSADCHIDAIIERKLGAAGKALRVAFDLIDESGQVYRVRTKLLPSP